MQQFVWIIIGWVSGGFSDAQYAERIGRIEERLARRAPSTSFHIVVEPPFIVIGDGPRQKVKKRARGTVRWAVRQLKSMYFAKDPDRVLEIWLFDGARSYQRNARRIFGHRPSTPFGYFSSDDDALIMNISTGGGTLVHEIVHPFMEANLPDGPSWLDEGLGSLYEASAELEGRIVGLVNWRLDGLQQALRSARPLPSFASLLSTNEHEFYSEDPGTNYAQARYLLYYLQEAGLLVPFYRHYVAHREADPTGLASLQHVLGRHDLGAFQREWEAWVLKLRRR